MPPSLKSITQIENGNLYGNDNEDCCICCWSDAIIPENIGKDDVPGTDWPLPQIGTRQISDRYGPCYCGCCPCTPGQISFSMTHCQTEVLGGPEVPPDRYVAECKNMEDYSFDLELRTTECFYTQNLAYQVNPDGIKNSTSRICGEVWQGEALHKLYGEYNAWQNSAEYSGQYGEMWGYSGVICEDGAGHQESTRAAFQFASEDPGQQDGEGKTRASCQGMGIIASLCCCKTGQNLGNENSPPPSELSASKCPAPWRGYDASKDPEWFTTEPGVPNTFGGNVNDGIFISPNCPSTHLVDGIRFGYHSVTGDDYTYPNAVNDVCTIGCYTFALYPDPYRYTGNYWVHGGWDWDAGAADPAGGGWAADARITNSPGELGQGIYLEGFHSACSPCNWHNIPFMPTHPYRVVTDVDGKQVFPGTSLRTPFTAQLDNLEQTEHNKDTGGTHHEHVGDAQAFGEGNQYSTPSAHTRLVSGNCYTSDSEFMLMVEGGFEFSYGCDCATGWLPRYYNDGIALQTLPNVCFNCGIMQEGQPGSAGYGAIDGCVGPKTEGKQGTITAPFDYGCEGGGDTPLMPCHFTIPCGDYAPTGRYKNGDTSFAGVKGGVVGANVDCDICKDNEGNTAFGKYSDLFINNAPLWNSSESARNILLAANGVPDHEALCSDVEIREEGGELTDVISAYGGCTSWYRADGADIANNAVPPDTEGTLGDHHGGFPHGCCPGYHPPLTLDGPGCRGPNGAPSQIYQCGPCTNCAGEAEGRRAVTAAGECAHGFMKGSAEENASCWPSGEHMEGNIFVRWSGILTS